MATLQPFYSSEPHCQVYHNQSACTEGNNIEKHYLRNGDGGKRLCEHCKALQPTIKIRIRKS